MKYIRRYDKITADYIIEEPEGDPGPPGCFDYLMIIFFVGCMLFMLALLILIIVSAFS